MIKENQRLFNHLNVITDALAAVVSMAVAFVLVFNLLDFGRNYPLSGYLRLLLIFVPVQLVTYGTTGLYESFRTKHFPEELNKLFRAFLADGLILIALLYVIKIMDFSRWALVIFLVLDFILVTLKRYIMRRLLRRIRSRGLNSRQILLVGSGAAARDYLKTINEQPWLGFYCAGCVAETPLEGVNYLGGMDNLLSLLEEYSFDDVICALGESESSYLQAVVEACEVTGTKISVIPMIYKYMSSTPAIDVVGNVPLMNIRRIPLDNKGNAAIKRAMDITGSLLLLVLTSPVILVSMLIIKLTMGGNVIFKQERVGLNKEIFTMYKLKSMRDSDESNTAWSTDNDPRRTKFGAFIRKFSIDELPQLVNVLKGDMSLVGPRPEIPYYVDSFKDKIPMYMIKHQVKPGITGLAQINGYRGDTSIEKRIELDVQYIESWNFFLDISILLRTALSGFINKEKLSEKRPEKKKLYKAEKLKMTNKKGNTDLMALVIFLPSIIAAALVPTILRITTVITDLRESYTYLGESVEVETSSGTEYHFIDVFSQGKAMAVAVLSLIMIGMVLLCCLSLFKRIEKRSLVYVGCSAVFVTMTLISALMSKYEHIAFMGEYDRAEGFWTTACYFVMFLFTMYAFKTTGNFKYLMYGLFFCVGINFIFGVSQVLGKNILTQEWFMNLIADSSTRDTIQSSNLVSSTANGTLYHSNYMGSFTGMLIPLFTVMAIYTESKLQRVLYIIFDCMAVFLLFGSTARSGIVAVAAAFVAGVVIFARQIAKHWKRCTIFAVSVVLLLVGVNAVLNNRLFARIPSLVRDAVGMFLPADEEDTDLFSKIPLREISTPADGSLILTGQNDVMTVTFDSEKGCYSYVDKNGNPLPRFSEYSLPEEYGNVKIYEDFTAQTITVSFNGAEVVFAPDSSGVLTVQDPAQAEAAGIVAENDEIGTLTLTLGDKEFYMTYDTEANRALIFDELETAGFMYLTELITFPGTDFKDVSFTAESTEGTPGVRNVFLMNFYRDTSSSLIFNLVNERKIQLIHHKTGDAYFAVNAPHFGFEGKEQLGSSRGYIWSRTIPLLKKCLLIGYGADTFTYIFPQNDLLAKYYSYNLYNQGFNLTVDKPHDLYLQIFVYNGLIALLAFLGIVIFYLVDCFRLYALKREYRQNQIMGAAVMLAVVGYLAAGIFNDSMVSVAPVFWILLGTGAALNTINRREDNNIQLDEDYAPVKAKKAVPSAEEIARHDEISAMGQQLAERMRLEDEQKMREKTESRKHITEKDVANLLESIRAMKPADAPEKTDSSEDESNDNV